MTFITSDLHVGHARVIEYCNRQFLNVGDMNEAIINTINATVGEKDTLHILGDISLSAKWMEFLMERIICKDVRLVIGNHDDCFHNKLGQKKEKTEKMLVRYFKAGFKSIKIEDWIFLQAPRKGLLGKLGFKKRYKVQLSHFPFVPKREDGSNGDCRYLANRPEDNGQILLHGHSHCYYRKNGRQIDVGIDGDFKVWSEEDIINFIEDKRHYIPSPITEYYKSRKDKLIKKDEY